MNVCALIPSYNPDKRLISTVEDLQPAGFYHIIAIDDGSRPDCQPYFDALTSLPWIWLGLVSAYLVSGLIGFSTHHTDVSQCGVNMKRESKRYVAITALQSVFSGLLLGVLSAVFPTVPLFLAKVAAECVLYPCFSRLQDHIAFSQALAKVRRAPVFK